MSAHGFLLITPWAAPVLGSLGHASWQGGAGLALVWAGDRAFPRLSPRLRCWLWRLAYLKLFAAFLWTAPLVLPLLPPAPAGPRPPTAARGVPAFASAPEGTEGTKPPARVPDGLLPERARPLASSGARALPVSGPSPLAPAAPPRVRSTASQAADGAGWLLLLWMTGGGLNGWRVACQWRASRRLTGAAAEADAWLRERCAALGRRLELRRLPRLLLSDAAGSPVLVGVLSPALVLPPSLPAACSDDELRLILAHELAHLKRRDLLWAWLPTAARVLFFFHPLVWISGGAWRLAQEIACDELAMGVTGVTPDNYGRVLLKVAAQRRTHRYGEPLAVGTLGSYQSLRRRLLALPEIRPLPRRRRRLIGSLLVVGGAMLIVPWRVTARESPAQPPWPGFYWGDRPGERIGRDLFMLRNPQRQAALALTDRERTQVGKAMTDLRRRAGALGPIWSVSPRQRAAALEKNHALLARAHRQMEGILTTRQMARLRKIELQQEGAFALPYDDVARTLRLTSNQRQQLRSILRTHWHSVQVLGDPLQPSRRSVARRAGIRELQHQFLGRFGQIYRDSQRRMLAVLTPSQRDRFFQMMGRPYPPLADTFPLRLRQRASLGAGPALEGFQGLDDLDSARLVRLSSLGAETDLPEPALLGSRERPLRYEAVIDQEDRGWGPGPGPWVSRQRVRIVFDQGRFRAEHLGGTGGESVELYNGNSDSLVWEYRARERSASPLLGCGLTALWHLAQRLGEAKAKALYGVPASAQLGHSEEPPVPNQMLRPFSYFRAFEQPHPEVHGKVAGYDCTIYRARTGPPHPTVLVHTRRSIAGNPVGIWRLWVEPRTQLVLRWEVETEWPRDSRIPTGRSVFQVKRLRLLSSVRADRFELPPGATAHVPRIFSQVRLPVGVQRVAMGGKYPGSAGIGVGYPPENR